MCPASTQARNMRTIFILAYSTWKNQVSAQTSPQGPRAFGRTVGFQKLGNRVRLDTLQQHEMSTSITVLWPPFYFLYKCFRKNLGYFIQRSEGYSLVTLAILRRSVELELFTYASSRATPVSILMRLLRRQSSKLISTS